MVRVLIVLFWVSLLTGTLLAHNIVANWAVTLIGLYFLVRWRRSARLYARRAATTVTAPTVEPAKSERATQRALAETAAPSRGPAGSRWTVDHFHAAERRWR